VAKRHRIVGGLPRDGGVSDEQNFVAVAVETGVVIEPAVPMVTGFTASRESARSHNRRHRQP
jgi:hypothetical protein